MGTSLQVLLHIINAHPILPPPPPHNSDVQTSAKITATGTRTGTLDETKTKSDDHAVDDVELAIEDMEDTEDEDDNGDSKQNENKNNGTPLSPFSHFTRESTRSEIIHSLEKHHGILTLFFQDLSRYMNAYNPQTTERKEADDDGLEGGNARDGVNNAAPRQIVNFRARFDFLQFILQFSSLHLSSKQLDDLWNIVIGDTLKSDCKRPTTFKNEQNYFFKWLKDICPVLNTQSQTANTSTSAISIDDAVNLFHTKLGSMPRKTMTSDC